MDWTEWIGYLGSLLIAVSMIMNNLWRLRWVNLFGAAAFVVYGWLVVAWPVVVLNVIIVLADVYYLLKMGKRREYFNIQAVGEHNRAYLERFCEFYRADLGRLFPQFDPDRLEEAEHLFIERDLQPAGLFSYRVEADGTGLILADYVTPPFRDFKVARFLFKEGLGRLRRDGVRRLAACTGDRSHRKYLQKMGFRPSDRGPGWFFREIEGE